MTDSRPDAESASSKPRGLWSLMGRATSADEPAPVEPVVAPVEDSPVGEASAATPTTEEPQAEMTGSGRRGLWDLMKQAEAEPSSAEPPESVEPPEVDTTETPAADPEPVPDEIRSPAPRSLFALMQRSAVETTGEEEASGDDDVSSEKPLPTALSSPVDSGTAGRGEETEEDADFEDGGDHLAQDDDRAGLAPMEVIDPDELEPPRYVLALAQAQRQGRIGLACGVAAVAVSALAMLPYVWIGFPASILGFAAIIAGYLTLTGTARREMPTSTRTVTVAGMLLGTLGIFLGPLLFAGLGRDLREATGQQVTGRNLELMWTALKQHYDRHSAFPVGGTFAKNDAGVMKGQHGWMMFLLPFIGEQELYLRIQQDKPFDDPVNREAMGHDVAIYFAVGGDRSKIAGGYAVAHFAGVGGEINNDAGLSHLGIFERDEAVKREEITDGLSNTLIVGELPGSYPPWSDPENWRTIGRGLNQNLNGFGSAAGNGATFLFADGSVKFFNNKTDPKLLERLSTRDGGE